MRNKKWLMLLATAMLAGSLSGGIIASAGTVESKPAGEGVLTSSNELNNTNFKIIQVNEGDADAYVAEEVTDHVVKYNAGEWQGMQVGTPVPKELMAKPDAKVTLTYSFTEFSAAAAGAQLLITPGTSLADQYTYGYVLTGNDNGIAVVPAYRASATESDPTSKLIAHHGGDAVFDIPVQWQAYSWSAGTLSNYAAAYNNATFKIEMKVNAEGWVDVTLISGFFLDWQRWTNGGSTVTNWAPYDGTTDFYANVWGRYMDGVTLENANLSVSYTEDGETKTEVVFDCNMDSNVDVSAATEGKFIATGATHVQNGNSGLKVTNPALGSGIITRAELQTDKGLANNFELNAKVIPMQVAAGQKIGFGFGYKDNMEIAGEHSFFYFTENEGKVIFGGEKVDAAGATSALFPEVEVAGATIGEKAEAIPVVFAGKGNNMEITVGSNDTIVVENFDPNGYFAITHKGEGNLTYMLKDNLTMKGYQFRENEEGAEAITSNFDGNYLRTDKFQVASTTAPETFMIATENSHELTGITPENGKIGFYGTSTNTRILTTKKYADFVLQFDYISIPVQQRGALVLAGNRPSAVYLMFGMKEGGLPLIDSSVYAIGMYEGLGALDFYGNNETVVCTLGMATTCSGIAAKGLSRSMPATEKSAISIPEYVTGYNPDAADNGVKAWHDPNPDDPANIYSMYNKTTRVKLVCINNEVALYLAEVDVETGAIKGEYVEIMKFKAVDTEGYLGIGTDSPAYFEIDNLAITPVSREDTLAFANGSQAINANIVADILPQDMDSDPLPTPIDKPVLTVDAEAKKVTWQAVEGAANYAVTVKLGTETVLERTVEGTEIDLSGITEEGTYRVTVVANPADEVAHVSSRESVEYVIGAQKPEPSDSSDSAGSSDSVNESSSDETADSSEKSGCFGTVSGTMAAVMLLCAGIAVGKKRKED